MMSFRVLLLVLLVAWSCSVSARRLVHSSKLQAVLDVQHDTEHQVGETEDEVEGAIDLLLAGVSSLSGQVQGAPVLSAQQRNAILGIVTQTSTSSSSSKGVVFRGGFIEEDATSNEFVELESKAEVSTTTGALPGANVGFVGLVPIRQACRGGGGDPGMPFGGFTYVQDGHGRITHAYGNVFIPGGARPANAQAVSDYCDVLYQPNGAPNFNGRAGAAAFGVTGTGRNVWQSGHVIAYRLGGSSADPINFYPQVRTSNNQGGRWGRLEAIALRVKAACLANPVEVIVQFLTWVPGALYQDVRPATGRYSVIASNACYAALCVNNPLVAPYPIPAAGGLGAHAYLRAFCRHANQAGVAPNWRLQTDFSNDINDATQTPRDDTLFA